VAEDEDLETHAERLERLKRLAAAPSPSPTHAADGKKGGRRKAQSRRKRRKQKGKTE
jgi:hypothetical protein